MVAIGIALLVLGYATAYTGVLGITRGTNVSIRESLTPGFEPITPTDQQGGTSFSNLPSFLQGSILTSPLFNKLTPEQQKQILSGQVKAQ
jgi:hypothetical protein